MTTLLEAALEQVHLGRSIFPVDVKWNGEKYTKRPLLPEWAPYQKERPTEEQVKQWWTTWPNASIGCVAGAVSGVVRMDAEGPVPWDKYPMPETAEYKSISGGSGFLFSYENWVSTDVLWRGVPGKHEELRIQSDGAYFVIPPSAGYVWVREKPIAKVPKWLLNYFAGKEADKVAKEMEPWTAVPDNGTILDALKNLSTVRTEDYTSWIKVGIALHSAGDQYLTNWIEWSKQSSKFREGECEYLWSNFHRNGRLTSRSILHWAKQDNPDWRSPSKYEPFTDEGNGRVLARAGADLLRWCNKWRDWLRWDNVRWKRDSEWFAEVVYKSITDARYSATFRRMFSARKLDDKEALEKRLKQIQCTLKACRAQESVKAMLAAIKMAKTEPGIMVELNSEFDTHKHLFNCPNGTINLGTGELRPHDRKDLLTQMSPTEYTPSAVHPVFDKFMLDVFSGNHELVHWLQKFFGYCASGDTSIDMLVIFYGRGRNGKSTLVELIEDVLGEDYASILPSGFSIESRGDRHPTELAALEGKRFIYDVETDEGQPLNLARIKRMTGGDKMIGHFMCKDNITFNATHKLVIATNYPPRVRGEDEAMQARLKLVPFEVVFEGPHKNFKGETDHKIKDKLDAERGGILAWIIEGYRMMLVEGLGSPPAAMKLAASDYWKGQSHLGAFIEACCEVGGGYSVSVKGLSAAYTVWCIKHRKEQLDSMPFGRGITKLGFELDSNRKNRMGLRLCEEKIDE